MTVRPGFFRKADKASVCPYCGQPSLYERVGVRLTPVKAHLFDLIEAGGKEGINSIVLHFKVFGERATRQTMRGHIFQINEILEETDWRIKSTKKCQDSCYKLVKRKVKL